MKTRTLASLLFLLSRGMRRHHRGAGRHPRDRPRLEPDADILAIGLPTAVYTMVGGVQAVTWTT